MKSKEERKQDVIATTKWRKAHLEISRASALKWKRANPKARKAIDDKWCAEHPGYATKRDRERKEKKAGRLRPKLCEVCGLGGRICFDHDHITGEFRGWLCYHCNTALGYVRDSPDTLRKLARYLIKIRGAK